MLGEGVMIGCFATLRSAVRLIEPMVVYDAPVLIERETRMGTELAARAIQYCGSRCNSLFVPVNCGVLPDQLIDNELFGHRCGAYTHARDDHPELVALAHNGTLFLDEIDALTHRGQVAPLRFLQDQVFRPLGGRHVLQPDFRVVAACNICLAHWAMAGKFRLDLVHRLRLMQINLPPLRERVGDAANLAQFSTKVDSERFGKVARPFAAATLARFDSYQWPGNILEQENLCISSSSCRTTVIPRFRLGSRSMQVTTRRRRLHRRWITGARGHRPSTGSKFDSSHNSPSTPKAMSRLPRARVEPSGNTSEGY